MIPKRIVAIGTSTFFGLYDDEHLGGHIGRLKKWHESRTIDNEVYNLGVSRESIGETTTELLKRIVEEVKAREPHLILLTTGINDIRRFGGKENQPITPINTFEKNIHEMIVRAKEIAQDIIFISPIPIKDKESRQGDFFLSADVRAYAGITKNICQKEKIPYLDVLEDWKGIDITPFLCPDGVHPNGKGYEKLFENLKTLLLDLYR